MNAIDNLYNRDMLITISLTDEINMEPLKLLFKQRQKIAKLLLEEYTIETNKNLKDTLLYINSEIKKYLWL